MPHFENNCTHLNIITDFHEGTNVCTMCGLVLCDNVYIENSFEIKYSSCHEIEEIKEVLERLNFPTSLAYDIFDNLKKSLKSEQSKKYLIPFVIYQTLNKLGYSISIKDVASVSGITENSIYDMQNNEDSIIIDHIILLEKYCTILGFDYKTYSVIKELLPVLNTGHNPLTLIASTIYKYCKDQKLKYSMKHIASIVGISSVSIQRFLKKC